LTYIIPQSNKDIPYLHYHSVPNGSGIEQNDNSDLSFHHRFQGVLLVDQVEIELEIF